MTLQLPSYNPFVGWFTVTLTAMHFASMLRNASSLVLMALLFAAWPASASAKTYIFADGEGRNFAHRPASVMLPTVVNFETAKWDGWGARTARASGTAYLGGYALSPVTVVAASVELTRIRNCGGYRYYSRVSISYPTAPQLPVAGEPPRGWTTRCQIFLLDPFAGTSTDRPALTRPSDFYLGDIPFDSTKWRGWNSRKATGVGTTGSGNPARLVISRPRACASQGGILVYTRQRFSGKYEGKRFGGGGKLPGC